MVSVFFFLLPRRCNSTESWNKGARGDLRCQKQPLFVYGFGGQPVQLGKQPVIFFKYLFYVNHDDKNKYELLCEKLNLFTLPVRFYAPVVQHFYAETQGSTACKHVYCIIASYFLIFV